jgi:phenylpropionate dioxygenase-like ring-hydroxylating dioxygenase large terminal subunit
MHRLPIRRDRGEYIKDAWYAIAPARDLRPGRPLGVRRLGRALALFRGPDGRVAALDATCPHRGADLTRGRVRDGALECPYHGFRFAPGGRCTAVPCEGAAYRVPDTLAAAPYVVREAHDWIWLWWGQPRDVYPDIPWRRELPDRRTARTADTTIEWDVGLPLAMESNLDIHHTPFAHRNVSPGFGARLDPYTAELVGGEIHSRGTLRRDDTNSGVTFRLDCTFPSLLYGQFGRIHLCAGLTPIDETHTHILLRYFCDLPLIGGLLAWLAGWSERRLVQPADLAQQRAAARSGLHLHECRFVPSDRAIVLWYSLYRRRTRDASAVDIPQPLDQTGERLP